MSYRTTKKVISSGGIFATGELLKKTPKEEIDLLLSLGAIEEVYVLSTDPQKNGKTSKLKSPPDMDLPPTNTDTDLTSTNTDMDLPPTDEDNSSQSGGDASENGGSLASKSDGYQLNTKKNGFK